MGVRGGGGEEGWLTTLVHGVLRMAPRSDRSVISQRLTRTRTRTRTHTGVSWMGSDVLCKVLRRFGLLQRSAGITTGSDRVGMRPTDTHPRLPSSLSLKNPVTAGP